MPDPTIEYFDQRAVLVKLETLADTDPVLSPATDGFQFFDGSCDTEFDKVEKNPDRPFWGGKPFGVANKRAWIEGNIDLFPPTTPGAAAAAGSAHASRILLPAGFAETKVLASKLVRYNPVSNNIAVAWSRFYQGGEILNVQSGRHTLSAVKTAIGEGMSAKARLQGIYTSVPEGVAPAVPVNERLSVVSSWDNSIMLLSTVDGLVDDLVLWGKSLSWDSGSEMKTTEFTGKRLTGHSGRTPTATAVFVRPKKSDIDLYAARDAGRLITLSYRTYEDETKVGLYSEHGVRMQIDTIKRTDVDKYYAYEISGPCIPSATGGDELYIAFGDTTP